MIFFNLDKEIKEKLHKEILSCANSIGGKNFFLQMLESIRDEKPTPLLNKSANFPFPKGRIRWDKNIYKETLNTLYEAIKKEDRDGDMIEGLKPKEYKKTMNMMRTLKPIEVKIRAKEEELGSGFSFFILDTTQEKKSRISIMFKIIFFYNMDFAKKALNYETE